MVKKTAGKGGEILDGTIIYRCHVMYVFTVVQQRKIKNEK